MNKRKLEEGQITPVDDAVLFKVLCRAARSMQNVIKYPCQNTSLDDSIKSLLSRHHLYIV